MSADSDDQDYEQAREEMVDRIVTRGDVSRGRVADALRAVPRHEFVPEAQRDRAYEDRPLPIGEGQTVSAPHMVGRICDLLDPDPGADVLEIGTGCGYHAAVTAELVGDEGTVYSVEYVEELAEQARETLSDLGYDVEVRVGDGHEGWPEHAPYDGAYLTCAPAELPDPIVEQTREGGVVVAPVGAGQQDLVRVYVGEAGEADREYVAPVWFVPMKG